MTIARQVAEYECVWSWARCLGFERLGVVGESYGATVALHSRLADPDAVCLLWPAIYFSTEHLLPLSRRRNGFGAAEWLHGGRRSSRFGLP